MDLLQVRIKDKTILLLPLQIIDGYLHAIICNKVPDHELLKIKKEKSITYPWLKEHCPISVKTGYRKFSTDALHIIAKHSLE